MSIQKGRKLVHSAYEIHKQLIVEEKEDEKKKEEEEKKPSDSKEDDSKKTDAEKKENKVMAAIKSLLKNTGESLLASNLDNFTLGNFKEAICEIYKEHILKNADQEKLAAEMEAVHKIPGFERAKKNFELDKRKDDNTNSDIDGSTTQYAQLFWSKNKDENLLSQLEQLTIEIQKQAKSMSDQKDKVQQDVKAKKIEGIDDKVVDAYGPIIQGMLKDGKSPEEIQKKIAELAQNVKESYSRRVAKYKKDKLLTEGKQFITEKQKHVFLVESICERKEYIYAIAESLYEQGVFDDIIISEALVNEGWKDKLKAGWSKVKGGLNAAKKLTGSLVKFSYNALPEKVRTKIESTVKEWKDKAIEVLKSGSLGPILSLAGIGLMVFTGAWGIALIIAVFTLIQRHGKRLKAAFDKHWDAFKNSKGVITQMDFSIKGDEKLKYSLRFYALDKTWRVLNLRNQSHTPSLDFAKEILGNEVSKKYMDKVTERWDKVFAEDKGGKVDFANLLSQAKGLNIDDKQIKMLSDFKSQYSELMTALKKPAIDTRAVSAKDAISKKK